MKKSILALLFVGLMASCSSDDDQNSASGGDYLPLTAGNFWTYNVTSDAPAQRDSLYIANDTVIGGNNYKKMKTLAVPFGFYSTALANNSIRRTNSALVLNGNAGLDFGGMLPINLALDNFVILKNDASQNQQLESVTGIINQDIQGYPLVIDYTLKSVAGASLPTFVSPNGVSYADVKSTKIILQLKITTNIDFGGLSIPFTILETQDVVSSTQYYSKNIGMVYAKTDTSYTLADFSQFGVDLGIPTSQSISQEEFLDVYVAQLLIL